MKRKKDATESLTPAELTVAVQMMVLDMQRLVHDYRGTYLAAYGPAVVGDGGRAGGTSDPTGNHALSVSRKRLREGLNLATRETRDMQASVKSMLYVLEKVMGAVDPPPSANLRLEDQMRASRAEIAESHEAQARRNGRGEGWGG